MRNLIATIKVKQKIEKPCKFCGEQIELKTQFVSVEYFDGFTKRDFGAFHLNCWEKYLIMNNYVLG